MPDHFKIQEMCNRAVEKDLCSLAEVADNFKTEELCNKAVKKDLCSLMNVPDHFKKQGICIEAVKKYRYWQLSLTTLRHKKCMTRQLG